MIAPTISPHDSHTVVEHCDMTGGYITHDDGQSWRMFNLRGGIETFSFDKNDPKVIYAGNAAIWRSSDAGQTWSMVFPAPGHHTTEHQLGDHSDYVLTSDDASYPGGSASAIAVDAHDSRKLYAAFSRKGGQATVVTSQDGGISWTRVAILPGRVALLSADASGVIALSGGTAYKISIGGQVSSQGGIPGQIESASTGEGATERWFYATDRAGKVYTSQDSGRHWTESTPVLGQTRGRFEAIAASEDHPGVAYVGFRGLQLSGGKDQLYNGIARTADGGRTWRIAFKESTQGASNLKGGWIEQRATQEGMQIWFDAPYSLGVAPSDANVVYATDLFRTYRSLDGGSTWEEMNSARVRGDQWRTRGLDVTTDYGVQFDPFDVKHIFIDYTDIGLFQSRDRGESWHSSTSGIPEDWRNTTYWLAFDPLVKGRMWGAFSGVHDLPRPKMWRGRSPLKYTGGVAISNDSGEHWTPSGTGLPSDSVTHILLDPTSTPGHRTLYATAFGRGVYKSTDDGKTWAARNNGIPGKEPLAWRLTQGSTGELYLVVARRSEGEHPSPDEDGELYRSSDRAEHWERIALPAGVNGPTAIEIDPRNSQRLYLSAWGREGTRADSGGGVYVTENGGATWKPLFTESQHVYDVTVDGKNPDVLYICGFDAAAFRSIDRGAHWTRIRGFNFKWGHRVVLDPLDPKMIYITTYGGGVWHGPVSGGKGQEDVLTILPIAQ